MRRHGLEAYKKDLLIKAIITQSQIEFLKKQHPQPKPQMNSYYYGDYYFGPTDTSCD